jgi:two-component system response regulator DevR
VPRVVKGRRAWRNDTDPLVGHLQALAAGAQVARPIHRDPTQPPIRVLVVESQPILRLGLTSLFAHARSCHVVGEAATAEGAVDATRALLPDVIVMDADLPGGSGIVACKRIRAEDARFHVVLLAAAPAPLLLVTAIEADANGYLLKDVEPDRLIAVVETVAAGGAYFEPSAIADALHWLRAGRPPADPFSKLSQQEHKVLALIAEGRTNGDIGAEMNLTQLTVKTYVSSILRKLGVASRAQAAALFVRRQDEATSLLPP